MTNCDAQSPPPLIWVACKVASSFRITLGVLLARIGGGGGQIYADTPRPGFCLLRRSLKILREKSLLKGRRVLLCSSHQQLPK